MFFAISYDIKDNARRLKIANVLKDFGARVQLSVFEAFLDPGDLERLQTPLNRHLNPEEDSLRLYPRAPPAARASWSWVREP